MSCIAEELLLGDFDFVHSVSHAFVSSFIPAFVLSIDLSFSVWLRLPDPVRLSTESTVSVMSGMIKKPSGPLRTGGRPTSGQTPPQQLHPQHHQQQMAMASAHRRCFIQFI